MQIDVIVRPTARQELLALLEERSPNRSDAVGFAFRYLEDMEQQFVEHEGFPPGSKRARGTDPPNWWWRYVNGVWVVFTVEESRGWLFGAAGRVVTVIGFAAGPTPA